MAEKRKEKRLNVFLNEYEAQVIDRFTKLVGMTPTGYARVLIKRNIDAMRKRIPSLEKVQQIKMEESVPGLDCIDTLEQPL